METNTLNQQIWTLDFERDGTEDVAIILDEDGEELVRSRPFWLPEDDDPIPSTLLAVQLMAAAPALLEILESLTDRISELEGISSVIDEDLMQGKAFREAVALLARLEPEETRVKTINNNSSENESFTPGPWEQDCQFIVAPDPRGIHPDIYIAEIAEHDEEGRIASPEQQQANARLIVAAPGLLAACRMVVERWERGDLAEAARACQKAIDAFEPPAKIGQDDEVQATRQIAIFWAIEDVQEIRPDLDDDQAWEVLQAVEKHENSYHGITWDTLESVAEFLYPQSDGE